MEKKRKRSRKLFKTQRIAQSFEAFDVTTMIKKQREKIERKTEKKTEKKNKEKKNKGRKNKEKRKKRKVNRAKENENRNFENKENENRNFENKENEEKNFGNKENENRNEKKNFGNKENENRNEKKIQLKNQSEEKNFGNKVKQKKTKTRDFEKSKKKKLKVQITDFNGYSIPRRILETLQDEYQIVNSSKPDLLLYSVFGEKHYQYWSCLRVFFTGENKRPNFKECNLAITFDHNHHSKNFRFPLWIFYCPPERLIKDLSNPISSDSFVKRENFCGFVAKNDVTYRTKFVKKLMEYRKVHCPGKVLRNVEKIGRRNHDKLEFLQSCKFNVCYENASHAGYVTEKLIQAFQAGCIPIYWGCPKLKGFNRKAFLNRLDFKSDREFIEKIKEVDQNDDLYFEMLNQPVFENNKIPKNASFEKLGRRLKSLLRSHYIGQFHSR